MTHPFPFCLAAFAAVLCCFRALPGMAAETAASPANPKTVQLSPKGGLFTVMDEIAVTDEAGSAVLYLILPADASGLSLTVPGRTIASWSSAPQILKRSGAQSRRAEALLAEQGDIERRLALIEAQLILWRKPPERASYNDLAAIEAKILETLPNLHREQAMLAKRLEQLREEAEDLEPGPDMGQKVRVVLASRPETERVRVEYSYSLPHCGWEPVYDFSAHTGDDKNKGIGVRLLAEVWQRTGMDWVDTQLTLVTRGGGPREPGQLARWELAAPAPRSAARGDYADQGDMMRRHSSAIEAAAPMEMADEDAVEDDAAPRKKAVPSHAATTLAADSLYARWDLTARGLNEGRSRLLMTEAQWQAPLTWLARPTSGTTSAPVWLTAQYKLPAGEVWPEGRAEYNVDGQNVGTGRFRPEQGEARLFFGADPRVSLTISDDRKRGQSGFFDKRRHWTWAWTYTFTNSHAKPVTVRVERPQPRIVDQKITVKHENEPAASVDAAEHRLFWNLEVPASGTAKIRHGLTVSAPEDMAIFPTAP